MNNTLLARASDVTGLLEDPRFLDAFCGGCRVAPRAPWEDCPAGGDPRDDDCPRRRAFADIEVRLEEISREIAERLEDAGCVA